jgi:ketopantoate hydroxymethyltransferase
MKLLKSFRFKTYIQLKIFKKYSSVGAEIKKKTILDIKNKYTKNEKIIMLTSYDYSTSFHVNKCDVDMILIGINFNNLGDSLNMIMLGNDDTKSVTMDEMILHCKSVANGAKNSFLIGDLPFGVITI